MGLEVIYTPAQIDRLPERDLSETCCVVVDQLRATSSIVTALAHGAACVYAVREVEEARRLAQLYPNALLAGERGGLKPDGFTLGNSPREFTSETVGQKEIILTTTNGTRALLGCRKAARILAASFLNVSAVLDSVRLYRGPVLLVAAGTDHHFALEDGLVLGKIAQELDPSTPIASLYRSTQNRLLESLYGSVNGRHLSGIGVGEDIAWAAHFDRFDVVPVGHLVETPAAKPPVLRVRLTLEKR